MSHFRPLISIVIPTIGNPGLERTFDSLDLNPGAELTEVIVVADSYGGVPGHIRPLVEARGERYRYIEYDGGLHAWGHPQRNIGMRLARAPWIWFLADDDIAAAGVFCMMVQAVNGMPKPAPLLFRVAMCHLGVSVWRYTRVAEANVDAECLLLPNVPERFGIFTNTYEGDHAFIRATVDHWGGDDAAVWFTEIVAIARPTPALDWVTRLKAKAA